MSRRASWLLLCSLAIVIQGSCRKGPSRITPPAIDASAAGAGAMSAYDKNGDGVVAGEELEAAPSLSAAINNLDLDKDGRVTADEVTARVEAWQATDLGLMSVPVNITLDGEPLVDAEVTFEPETFLGDNVKPSYGTTGANGAVYLSIAEDQRQQPNTTGVQIGLYKVVISKLEAGKETVPAQYNTETILGAEVALDAEETQEGYKYDLTSSRKRR
jgi:hypothetical protein